MSKGSWVRPHNHEVYSRNFEKIFQSVQDKGMEEAQSTTAKQASDVPMPTLQRDRTQGNSGGSHNTTQG